MVTAELALALPVLVAVVALCLGVLGLLGEQLRCTDAAAAGARVAARGEPDDAARRAAVLLAPGGARVSVRRGAGSVTVEIDVEGRAGLGALRPSARVTMPTESSEDSLAGPGPAVAPGGVP